MLHVSKVCLETVTTFDFSTLPKHATRCIVIYGGLEAATVILPATPLTRRTSFVGRALGSAGMLGKTRTRRPPHGGHGRRVGCAPPTPLARVLRLRYLSAWCCSSSLPEYILLHPRFSHPVCPSLCCCCSELCCLSARSLAAIVARSLALLLLSLSLSLSLLHSALLYTVDLPTLRFAYLRPLLQSQ